MYPTNQQWGQITVILCSCRRVWVGIFIHPTSFIIIYLCVSSLVSFLFVSEDMTQLGFIVGHGIINISSLASE